MQISIAETELISELKAEYEIEGVVLLKGAKNLIDEIISSPNPFAALPTTKVTKTITNGVPVFQYILRDHPRKGGRCKWFTVAGQRVQGTYEKRYAEALEACGYNWVAHPKGRFLWLDENGKSHWYAPDFFLPDEERYVEVKGFVTVEARDKYARVLSQNPKLNLRFVFKADIASLERVGIRYE